MNTHTLFAEALLDPQKNCPPGLFCRNGADPASRFAVYRNNVLRSLIGALTDHYPVVAQLVGDEFFSAMARQFIRQHPPLNPRLIEYGNELAHFIEGFSPASCVPYLADIARLERLRVQAYHAADAVPLLHEQIGAALSDCQAPDLLHLQLHPSVSTLNSSYAVVAIWAAHQQPQGLLPGLDLLEGQNALVLRNGQHVEVFAVDPGSIAFIRGLQSGWPLGRAASCGQNVAPEFDLSQCLALLIGHNVITELYHHPRVSP